MTKTDITFTLIPSPIKSISFRIYSLEQDIILTGKKTIALCNIKSAITIRSTIFIEIYLETLIHF
jgi:hypothetical protein